METIKQIISANPQVLNHGKVKEKTHLIEYELPTYRELATELVELAKVRLAPRKLVLDENVKHLYRLLTLYFSGDKKFEDYSFPTVQGNLQFFLDKGLLLMGTTGRSKTFSLQTLFPIVIEKYYPDKVYACTTSYQVQKDFETLGIRAMDKYSEMRSDMQHYWYHKKTVLVKNKTTKHLFIDEIGAERLKVKHYGSDQEPMQTLIDYRTRLFTGSKSVTHATSNLSLEEFKELYSKRFYSRILELFNIVVCDGPDLRIVFKQ